MTFLTLTFLRMTQSIKKPRFEQLSSAEWEDHLKSWKRKCREYTLLLVER
jgi:hypothetical protein